MSAINIDVFPYGGWPNCYRLTNGDVEVIVTTDVGPRVIRYGFVGGQNLFYECKAQQGNSGEPSWMIRGGHRLWRAPEIEPDTYALDNAPVKVTLVDNDTITLLQPIEPETQLQKEISVTLKPDGTVRAAHRIVNAGPKSVNFAPWPATLLAPGGLAVVAFPPRGSHAENLLPTNPLVMWAYTNFSDTRWTFTEKYLCLKQDSSIPSSQKAGLFNEKTFAAYLLGTDLFTKRCEATKKAAYADYNTSFQIFTNPDFMELETLGPLIDLASGSSVSHVEQWSLQRDIRIDSITDEELDRILLPLMQ